MRLLFLVILIAFNFRADAQSYGCIDETLIQTGHYCFDSPHIDLPNYFNPICSCDGKTIDNNCIAVYGYGYTSWSEGPCTDFYTYMMSTFVTEGYLTFAYYAKKPGLINILIYNEVGLLQYEYREPIQSANFPVIRNYFDISFLPKGFYLFYMEKDGIQEVHKFVKGTNY